jgi:hypothetical protein
MQAGAGAGGAKAADASPAGLAPQADANAPGEAADGQPQAAARPQSEPGGGKKPSAADPALSGTAVSPDAARRKDASAANQGSQATPAASALNAVDAATAALGPLTGAAPGLQGGAAASASPNAAGVPGVPIAGIAVEIATRATEGKRHFEVRLDPPELGRIDVRLDIGRDGQVTSRLVVERAETLDLLRRDSQSLQQALQSAGLRTDGGGLQFSLRDQPGGQAFPPQAASPPKLLIVPDADVAVHEAVRRGYGILRGLGRGLDIRV